ncbi:hypothetical protein EMIHUDRAFT_465702 [Emiliania huxleyi CCMP1516]|uniref:Uncharacterized protein n=2 Tax=Emiliania huxleyi TaxID=2903 RepID=A0A0D3I8P7_EMIH1|nr:hypothetical protein EMIHUDRAFT_465702 [Emiliania huxleyi CCMP1516]EOD07632.1 hypothetical protein EMIHUDRAFT_465702 [Emiliania huxleyi CCMP1516]|eukprot:XP_005760061.1 hypothetical protein EMIHUDRAFT_465702 [Emiliania huxleyi CCMP1516]
MPPSDLLRLPVDELRSSRLAELLASIDAADAADAPLLTLLFDKAFSGDAGLQLLRSAAVQEALRATALVHADDAIRSFALVHCKRLAAAAADVSLLGASGVLQQIAVLVSDASLGVSQRAVGFFVACAASAGALRAVLDHAPSRTALLAPCAAAAADPAGGVPALALRTLALFGEIAAIGDAQCAMCEESGALDLALAAWRGSDELVRLNALEVFALLARVPRGLHWLEAHGVVDDLLAQARGAEADGDAPMAEALSSGGLLGPLWRQLEPAGGGARDAALAAVRGAACSRRGCILVLRQTASGGAADPLARLLRSSDARAKVGAFAVAAQLCSSCARFAADGEVASVQPALRALIAAVSPSAGTAPGDALAALELRVAALRLLLGLAQLEWGAGDGAIWGETGRDGEIWGEVPMRLQDVGLVGAAAAGMMMLEMIKAAAMMAAVMKTTMVMLAAIESGDGEEGKSAELEPAGGGARDAALAAVRGAACSRRGCILVLRQTASGGAADPLARLLRSSDARAKVGAFAVAAQLCSSCARFAADGEVASVQPALRALALARCEGLLHLLLHAEAVLTPDELRDKHALASALLKSTAAADVIGAGAATVRQLREYVAAGPFAAQSKAEARPEGPLTL